MAINRRSKPALGKVDTGVVVLFISGFLKVLSDAGFIGCIVCEIVYLCRSFHEQLLIEINIIKYSDKAGGLIKVKFNYG